MSIKATEINLVNEVHSLLCQAGLVKESEENFLSYPSIVVIKDANFVAQMAALNIFWRVQLSRFGSESQLPRYCLVDEAEPKLWLRLFKDSVLPFIISKNLPSKTI